MKITIHILSGCPASGKSTYAKSLAKGKDNYYILSRDEMRNVLRKQYSTDEYFPVSHEEEYSLWKTLLATAIEQAEDGDHLIVDQTSASLFSLKKLIDSIKPCLDKKVHAIKLEVFDTPLEVCLQRNALRTGHERAPENVVKSIFSSRLCRLDTPLADTERLLQDFHYANLSAAFVHYEEVPCV